MISYDIAKEMLDILGLKYSELDNETLEVVLYDETVFPHPVATFISIYNDDLLVFFSCARDYAPEGNLLEMANRHNKRAVAPTCQITEDGDVVFSRAHILRNEVSPIFLLENIFRPGIFLPMDAYITFERTDEELNKERNDDYAF